MRNSTLVVCLVVVILLLFVSAQPRVPAAFALPSFTSSNVAVPTTNTCAGCHSGSAAAGGGAVVNFSSGTYTPGVTQHLSVKITDPSHTRGGYLLTARLASGVSSQAGTFTATDVNSTVVPNGAIQDLEAASFGTLTWNFDWTPPATNVGNVNFYLIGLATGSPGGSTSGNGVYQSVFTLTPAAAVANFSLSASPGSVAVTQGSSGSTTVTVSPLNGFSGSVNLAASGLPSGVTASFSPSSATTSSTLTLTASSSATTGTATVTITGTSGSTSHTTTVALTVNSAQSSTLAATPTAIKFSYQTGAPAPASQPVLVSSSPSALNFTVSASGGMWLSASLGSGTTPATVNVSASPGGLAVGTYGGTVTIASAGAAGSPQVVHVTLEVASPSGSATLMATPNGLQFAYQRRESALHAPQMLTITGSNNGLAFSASTSGASWITLSSGSGTTPGKIAVSANPQDLPPGSYQGQIHISAAGATAITVPVTLTVTGGENDGEDDGGHRRMFVRPYFYDPSLSGTLNAVWVDRMGEPKGNGTTSDNPGLVLSKNTDAPAGTEAGAILQSVEGMTLTELGFDYRDGGQCTTTSPRFVVITTDSVSHVVGGCIKGTIQSAPARGWKRVRFDLAQPNQTVPPILRGQQVMSITLVMDQAPDAAGLTAGGIVVIDNIDVNGELVGKL